MKCRKKIFSLRVPSLTHPHTIDAKRCSDNTPNLTARYMLALIYKLNWSLFNQNIFYLIELYNLSEFFVKFGFITNDWLVKVDDIFLYDGFKKLPRSSNF